MLFDQNLYDEDFEKKFLHDNIKVIEEAYSFMRKFPTNDQITILSEEKMREILEQEKDQQVIEILCYEIYSRIKFLFYSHIYKTMKLIEGISVMYNQKNYLGWVNLGRALLEHSAIFHYYVSKIYRYKTIKINIKYLS